MTRSERMRSAQEESTETQQVLLERRFRWLEQVLRQREDMLAEIKNEKLCAPAILISVICVNTKELYANRCTQASGKRSAERMGGVGATRAIATHELDGERRRRRRVADAHELSGQSSAAEWLVRRAADRRAARPRARREHRVVARRRRAQRLAGRRLVRLGLADARLGNVRARRSRRPPRRQSRPPLVEEHVAERRAAPVARGGFCSASASAGLQAPGATSAPKSSAAATSPNGTLVSSLPPIPKRSTSPVAPGDRSAGRRRAARAASRLQQIALLNSRVALTSRAAESGERERAENIMSLNLNLKRSVCIFRQHPQSSGFVSALDSFPCAPPALRRVHT